MRDWLAFSMLITMCLLAIGGNQDRTAQDKTPQSKEPTEDVSYFDDETDASEWFVIDEQYNNCDEDTNTPEETVLSETEPEETDAPTVATEQKEDGKEEPVSIGTFRLTAYCSCVKCCGKYATNRPIDENGNEIVYGSIGVRLEAGVSIAVDPKVIPYGTHVVINGHTYIAQDTGTNIKGNRIDIYFDDHQEALNFGTQKAEVFICG